LSYGEKEDLREKEEDDFEVIIEGEGIEKKKSRAEVVNNNGIYDVFYSTDVETDIKINVYVDGEMLDNSPISASTKRGLKWIDDENKNSLENVIWYIKEEILEKYNLNKNIELTILNDDNEKLNNISVIF
jgi:hypothetical protein